MTSSTLANSGGAVGRARSTLAPFGPSGRSGMTVSPDSPLGRGELAQAHAAAGVELLRGDPDLCAEPELFAVGECGRGVDHNRGGVAAGGELARGGQIRRNDGLGVAGAGRVDVLDGRV